MSRWREALRAVIAVVGVDELLLSIALALIVVGLWPLVGQRALLVPGLVLLWIVLPSRQPFLHRSPAPSPKAPVARRSA